MMNVLFILSTAFLLGFAVLATYDGVYLHLWKFELFKRNESFFEHKIHTIRAFLFPLILWFLILESSFFAFVVGVVFVIFDMIIMAVDAYSEEDSRKFMSGLPRWEYILHLFANGLHFAGIIGFIAVKLKFDKTGVFYSVDYLTNENFKVVELVVMNILPGAFVIAFLHFFLMSEFGKKIWSKYRQRVTCC